MIKIIKIIILLLLFYYDKNNKNYHYYYQKCSYSVVKRFRARYSRRLLMAWKFPKKRKWMTEEAGQLIHKHWMTMNL